MYGEHDIFETVNGDFFYLPPTCAFGAQSSRRPVDVIGWTEIDPELGDHDWCEMIDAYREPRCAFPGRHVEYQCRG